MIITVINKFIYEYEEHKYTLFIFILLDLSYFILKCFKIAPLNNGSFLFYFIIISIYIYIYNGFYL